MFTNRVRRYSGPRRYQIGIWKQLNAEARGKKCVQRLFRYPIVSKKRRILKKLLDNVKVNGLGPDSREPAIYQRERTNPKTFFQFIQIHAVPIPGILVVQI